MSKRHFSYLLIVAVVVAIAVVLVPSKTGQQAERESGPFLPELAERVNDVDLIRVSTARPTCECDQPQEVHDTPVEEADSAQDK